MGAGDDSAHSQNEKIDVRNYIKGVSTKQYCFKSPTTLSVYFSRYLFIFFLFQTKLMAAYLYEVSKIKH